MPPLGPCQEKGAKKVRRELHGAKRGYLCDPTAFGEGMPDPLGGLHQALTLVFNLFLMCIPSWSVPPLSAGVNGATETRTLPWCVALFSNPTLCSEGQILRGRPTLPDIWTRP